MANEPISVLHFSNSFVRGGAEEHILTLLRNLDRKYFRLYLVCPSECAEKLKIDLPADVHLIPLSLQKPYELRSAMRFVKILRANKIGILHSHLFGSSLAASPVGWFAGVPVIMETPHIREAWRHGLIKGHFVIDRIVSHFVDHYIAVSAANARYLKEEKGFPARKVHVIQNGCDLEKFNLKESTSNDIRQSLGFAERDLVFLALGRLEPQKGHRFLLQAYAQVLREYPSARLVCVGEGSLRQDLEKQSRELDIHGSVRFVGYQSNTADWLAMADISVLPSLYEGLPLVAIESLAAQRPMIATSVDGTTEVVVNEKTGLTVRPGDVQELANAMLRLIRQPELRRQLSVTGRTWVVEHFSQEQQLRQTQDLYLHAWDLKSHPTEHSTVKDFPERAHEDTRGRSINESLNHSEK